MADNLSSEALLELLIPCRCALRGAPGEFVVCKTAHGFRFLSWRVESGEIDPMRWRCCGENVGRADAQCTNTGGGVFMMVYF